MDNLTGDYILTVAIPFVIAILALAFPLMLDASSKISNQYKSSLVARSFQKELAFRSFVFLLIVSLVSILVYFIKIPVLDNFKDVWFVSNSAVLLVYASVVLLIVSLLYLSLIINVYYDQDKLIKHLVRRYKCRAYWYSLKAKCCKNSKNGFDKATFNAISKLMNFSISDADEDLAREVFSIFCDAFVKYRAGKEEEEIVYPDEFYNAVFEASELLCRRQHKTVSYYNDGTLYDFFIDSYQNTKISYKTLRFIWMCAIQNVSYGRSDYIFGLWKKIFQHTSLFLDNKPDKREEKDKFIEFGQVLCGYVMASGEYNLVKKMLEFTQMKPAKYVLTPSSTQGVIDAYINVDKHNDFGSLNYPVYFESLYPQPGADGVDAGDVIQHRTYDFLGLCFLWQYIVFQTYLNQGYSDTVFGGNSAEEKQKTIEVLERLRRNVETVCSNKSLCEKVGLKDLDYEQPYNGRKSPKQWFEDNIQAISNDLAIQEDADERNMTIPDEMVQKYNDLVAESCGQMFSDIQPYLSDYDKAKKTASIKLSWRFDVNLKSHIVRSMNYVEVTGSLLAQDYKANMWLPLLHMNVARFTLTEDDAITLVLKRIKRKRLVIFNFGVWINEQKMQEDGLLIQRGDKLCTMNGVEIVNVNSYPMHPALVHSFIIIAKTDLPSLTINDVKQEEIEETGLVKVEQQHKVYASVIDFNNQKWAGIKGKYCRDEGNENKYAMFCSYVNSELHYKPESKVMQLNIYNQFTDRTAPMEVADVPDIWKK